MIMQIISFSFTFYFAFLVFRKCNLENEFRCGYGRCYPDDVRCNGVKDCTDGTDELDCRMYYIYLHIYFQLIRKINSYFSLQFN